MNRTFVVALTLVASASSLRLEDAIEGSCQGIRSKPISNVDINFLDSLNYLAGANRYVLYTIASGHPRFQDMREFELYYDVCVRRNVSFATGQGSGSGFGGSVLINFTTRLRKGQPGVIDEFPVGGVGSPIQVTVTLTDLKTFAFYAICITGSDQRGFELVANIPELSPSAKSIIGQHAISLGFSREEIVFLSYKSCENNPLTEYFANSRGGVSKKATVQALPGSLSVKKATGVSTAINDAPVPWTSVGSGWSR